MWLLFLLCLLCLLYLLLLLGLLLRGKPPHEKSLQRRLLPRKYPDVIRHGERSWQSRVTVKLIVTLILDTGHGTSSDVVPKKLRATKPVTKPRNKRSTAQKMIVDSGSEEDSDEVDGQGNLKNFVVPDNLPVEFESDASTTNCIWEKNKMWIQF